MARVYGQHTNHAVCGGARCSASHTAGQIGAEDRSDRCRPVEPAKGLRTLLEQHPVGAAHIGLSFG
jgi:hypothetical protein